MNQSLDDIARLAENVGEAVAGQKVSCPHCSNTFNFSGVVDPLKNSRMSFSLTPAEGSLMTADHIGGILTAMHKLIVAVSRDMGVKATTLVEKVSTGDDGAIQVDFAIVRVKPIRRRATTEER